MKEYTMNYTMHLEGASEAEVTKKVAEALESIGCEGVKLVYVESEEEA